MNINFAGVTKDTWVRTIILVLSLINTVLIKFGVMEFADVDFELYYEQISTLLTVGASLWCAWKNNSFTYEAQVADEARRKAMRGEYDSDGIEYIEEDK